MGELENLKRGTTAFRRGNYQTPSNRQFTLTVNVEELGLATLPERMSASLHLHLRERLAVAADRVIDRAQSVLVPGHGYDTGLLRESLIKIFGEEGEDLWYDLLSDQAPYWKWVEFGHMLRNGEWWEGYHYLENAVYDSINDITRAVREAYADTVRDLAASVRWPAELARIIG